VHCALRTRPTREGTVSGLRQMTRAHPECIGLPICYVGRTTQFLRTTRHQTRGLRHDTVVALELSRRNSAVMAGQRTSAASNICELLVSSGVV
jgi:hypothetical protein